MWWGCGGCVCVGEQRRVCVCVCVGEQRRMCVCVCVCVLGSRGGCALCVCCVHLFHSPGRFSRVTSYLSVLLIQLMARAV